MTPPPAWAVAAASLPAGFAVADLTGVRPLGGLVLAAGAAWCAWRWWRAAGAARTIAFLGAYLAAFAGSHALADVIGAWPAVLVLAAGVGLLGRALGGVPVPRGAPA